MTRLEGEKSDNQAQHVLVGKARVPSKFSHNGLYDRQDRSNHSLRREGLRIYTPLRHRTNE